MFCGSIPKTALMGVSSIGKDMRFSFSKAWVQLPVRPPSFLKGVVKHMATLSPKIKFFDEGKLKQINSETLKLWNKYKIDMSLRELSQKTIDGYYNDLSHLWIYTLENFNNVPITELTEDDLTEFFYFCKMQGNNSRRIKRRMSSVAAFYKFLRKKKIVTENPMELIDRPSKDTDIITQTFLTKEQVTELFQKLEIRTQETHTASEKHQMLQQQVYICFGLSTMARVTAMSNTRWEQIDFDERTVNDVLEKEGKIVTLYFSDYVKKLLLDLKQCRQDNQIADEGYVFISKEDDVVSKVSPATLNQWCKKAGALINVPTLHNHDLRHSGSNLMRLEGAEIQDISALLNHSGTDVTVKHYLRIDKKKVKENRDKFGL